MVIALSYTDQVSTAWLLLAMLAIPGAILLRRFAVRFIAAFVALGAVCWFALHQAGVHPSLAGVVFGLRTPAWSFYDPKQLARHARPLVDEIERAAERRHVVREYERVHSALWELHRLSVERASPLERMVRMISLPVTFLVVPVFALANAGIPVGQEALSGWWQDPVFLGVALGLVVGKTTGVFLAVFITCRLSLIRLPRGARWRHMLGMSMCAGVSFTVSLFISEVTSAEESIVASAKLGVIAGYVIAGTAVLAILRLTASPTTTAGKRGLLAGRSPKHQPPESRPAAPTAPAR